MGAIVSKMDGGQWEVVLRSTVYGLFRCFINHHVPLLEDRFEEGAELLFVDAHGEAFECSDVDVTDVVLARDSG
jgi:hypothetical protein